MIHIFYLKAILKYLKNIIVNDRHRRHKGIQLYLVNQWLNYVTNFLRKDMFVQFETSAVW